jgi:hypothetical protein
MSPSRPQRPLGLVCVTVVVVVVTGAVGFIVAMGFTVGVALGPSIVAGEADIEGIGPGVLVVSPDGGAVGVI